MNSYMAGIEGAALETREGEPRQNHVVVDFFRHGESGYVEQLGGKTPARDLTPLGEKQVRENIQSVVEDIDPEREIIVLWSSPAWRAQGSEELLKEALVGKGINVYKDSEISSIRSFDQKDAEYMTKLWQELKESGGSPDTVYARDPKFQAKSHLFESAPEVRRRAERALNWIRYLAEHARLEGKKLHIIGFSHFEVLNPIMEDLFGHKVEEGKGIKQAEVIRLEFRYTLDTQTLQIAAEFRGERKEPITFDTATRKFVVTGEGDTQQ